MIASSMAQDRGQGRSYKPMQMSAFYGARLEQEDSKSYKQLQMSTLYDARLEQEDSKNCCSGHCKQQNLSQQGSFFLVAFISPTVTSVLL
jgi:hypothetical protein